MTRWCPLTKIDDDGKTVVKTKSGWMTGRKRDVYICTPMCPSARVTSSNIVFLEYGYRSTGTSVLKTEIGL